MKQLKVGLAVLMLLCTACSAKEPEQEEIKYMNCKRMNYFNIMDVETTIKVGYQGYEAITSETTENLNFYQPENVSEEEMVEMVADIEKQYKEQKEKMKNDQSIEFDYVVGDTYINTHGLIDYRKVDIEEVLKQDENMKDLMTDKKFDVRKLKTNYESLGSICTDLEGENQ